MVNWMKLGEFAVVQKTKNKKHITENAYSITQAGLIPTKSFFKKKTNITSSNTSGYYLVEKDWFVYSPSRIDVGSISYLKDEGPVIVSPIDVVFSIDTQKCLPSYLLNYFFTYKGKKSLLKNREGVEGMGRRNLPFDAIKTILIPIPSLSEQTRIVGILDTFTASIENLKKQIAQRRKQYEYYREQLLDLDGKEDVDMKTLGVIGKCIAGATPSTKESSYWEKGTIPWMSSGEIHQGVVTKTASFITQKGYDNASTKMLPKNTVVIALAGQGKTRGTVAITAIELCTNQSLCGIVIKNETILNKYVYFYLKTRYNDLRRISSGDGTRGGLNLKMVGSYPIPIPTIKEQSRIVSILDTFEASIANLEAQLKEREKQYEYYRNKLLTFE